MQQVKVGQRVDHWQASKCEMEDQTWVGQLEVQQRHWHFYSVGLWEEGV
jgi:hypothetical protein